MSAGVTFWRFPEEEQEFLDFLATTGTVVWVPSAKCRNKSELVPRPLDRLRESDCDSVLMGLADRLPAELPIRTFDEGSGPMYAVVMPMVPMVVYRRGKWRGPGRLGQSNVSARWTSGSIGGAEPSDYPGEFVKWGKNVIAWMRRQTPEWHQYESYRVTRKVADAIRNGGLEIVS